MNDVGQYIYRECQNLLFELDILGNSLSALPQHVRVTVCPLSDGLSLNRGKYGKAELTSSVVITFTSTPLPYMF